MKIINDEKFQEQLRLIHESDNEYEYEKKSIIVPLLLLGGAALIYHLWSVAPYKVIFPSFTISEYINQKYYIHSIFTGSLSLQNYGHFMTYFPLLAYSAVTVSIFMTSPQSLTFFAFNSLLCTGVTYLYEKVYRANPVSNLLIPKCNGGVTALGYCSLLLGLHPDRMLLKSTLLPYFIIPATYLMYEIYDWNQGEINEICRPAHLTAIANGIIYGVLFRKFGFRKLILK